MLYIDFEKEQSGFQDHSEANEHVLDFIAYWKSDPGAVEVSTSGSTGSPKKIFLTKRNIKASVQMSTDAFSLSSQDTFVCNLSLDSIAGKMMVIRAFELKAKLLFIPPSSDPLAGFINFEKANELTLDSLIFAFVPLQLKSILEREDKYQILKRAKAILIGGASIPQVIEDQLIDTGLPFWATYGMTETITHIAIRKLGEKEFIALPNVKLALSEKETLKIASPSTGMEWIETNDLAVLDKSLNKFEILGRKDNIINSGGVKIQLEKVEAILYSIIGLPLFCFGQPDDILGTKLCCAYQKENDMVLERDTFKGKMTNFEIPKLFYALDQFSYTKSGKIDKLKTINAYIEPQVSNK